MSDPTSGGMAAAIATDGLAEVEAVPAPEGPTAVIETPYEIGQDNVQSAGRIPFDVHNPVFAISAAAIVVFTLGTVALQYLTAVPAIDGVAQPAASRPFSPACAAG